MSSWFIHSYIEITTYFALVIVLQGLTSIDKLRDRASTIYVADNEDGPWRAIIKEREGPHWGSTDVSCPNHLPSYYIEQAGLMGASWSQQREIRYNGSRVAHARHRRGHNALYFDWHVEYVPAEESVVENWRPELH